MNDMDGPLPPSALTRVLLLLPEESLLGELRDLLRQQGYAVAASASGKKGREMLDQQQFAAVVADSSLPDLSGLELLVTARQMQPDACRILIGSAMTLSSATDAINKAEVFRLLLKPLQQDQFLSFVADALGRYQTTHQQRLLLKTTQAMNETLTKLVQTMHKPAKEHANP
jgi:DNA-binding NtrC family response regulator